MLPNNTTDEVTLARRALAVRILYFGFDDADVETVITAGLANGYVEGMGYSTAMPQLNI